jgi:hypothetical protein
MANGNDDKETIEVQRRRRTEGAPGERRRAEAPRRREPGAPAAGPSAGLGGTGGVQRPPSGPSLPIGQLLGAGGKPRPLSCLVIGIILVCIVVGYMLLGGGGDLQALPQEQGFATEPLQYEPTQPEAFVEDTPFFVAEPTLAPTRAPTQAKPPVVAPATTKGQKWLVMLYQDADDKVLEQDIFVDLNEAERVGSSDRVQLVAQVDRFSGGFTGDGNWTSAKRFYITQDDDLNRVNSKVVADLGEVNMSDPNTLVDFVTWAVGNYPADKYVLILSDHGMGWPGGFSDPAPGGRGNPRIPLAARLGNELYLNDMDSALEEIRNQTGGLNGQDKFEVVGLDACLMGQLEVLSALSPHARYAVLSEEIEPALGWAYTGFLEALTSNPDMSGAELSSLIVKNYIDADQRIQDPQARAEFLRQGSPAGGLFGFISDVPAAQLAKQIESNVTLSAVDMAQYPELMNSVNYLAFSLQGVQQQEVARARSYAQSYTSIFGQDVPPSYIDLGHFAALLTRTNVNAQVSQAAQDVLAAIQNAVIAEKHGPKKPGSTGVSIYFPNSDLYASPLAGPQSYTAIANRFASESLWDDFLAFHYTGQSFEEARGTVAVPSRSAAIRGPGSEAIQLSDITASSREAAPGRPVSLSVDISGKNIGYIYFFAGFYDQQANSLFVADTDYLESKNTRELNGVYYPDWGTSGQFTLKFDWEPLMFAINNTADSVTALFNPQSYGATFEEAVYTVDGNYTFADSGETQRARLYFSNGALTNVYGFLGTEAVGQPNEITPSVGDTFTVLEKWLDLDSQGGVSKVAYQDGGTLTFNRNQAWKWEELDAAVGQYVVGFIVTDLDGKSYTVFTQVTVR